MLHTAWVRWGALLGAILFILLLSPSVEPPQAAVGAPSFAPTSVVDDQSPNVIAPHILLGQLATPGAAGTPGVYRPVVVDSSGRFVSGSGSGAGTPVAGNLQNIAVGDFSGNAIQPIAGAVDDAAAANLVRLLTGSETLAYDSANNLVERVRIEPTLKALSVDARTNQMAAVATIVLPAQTPVAYTALDAMAAATPAPLTFAGMCRQNGGSGTIVKARQLTDQTANTARIRIHLFNASPSAITDNAAFTLLFSTAASYIGYVDLPPGNSEGSGSTAAAALNTDARVPYLCASGDTALYGLPETLDAFTPGSAQQWFWAIIASRD